MEGRDGELHGGSLLVLPIVLMVTVLRCSYVCTSINSLCWSKLQRRSERTAYNWDNSHKIATTGSVEQGQYDSLYWRLTDDNVVGSLFGLAGEIVRGQLHCRRARLRAENCPSLRCQRAAWPCLPVWLERCVIRISRHTKGNDVVKRTGL